MLGYLVFSKLINEHSRPRLLIAGLGWAEGPLWLPAESLLLVSDIPADRIVAWSEATGPFDFRAPSSRANGNALDPEGRLVTCEHGERRVTRREPDGTITVLADRFCSRRLNSPNDLVVLRDGTILFTDPDYALLSTLYSVEGKHEIGANNVYRIDAISGEVTALLTDFDKPNGLAVSSDESRLYVADSGRTHRVDGPHHVRQFALDRGDLPVEDGAPIVIEPGVPDGLKLDCLGNLWISAHDGVHCHAPNGEFIGLIPIPEIVANLAFGGPDGRTLFIAASTSVYAVDLLVKGALWA